MNHYNTHQELMIYLADKIEKEQRLKSIVSSMLLSIGILLFYFSNNHPAILIISMILSLTGLKFLMETFKENETENARLLYVLEYSPKEIVWIYSIITENMPFGIRLFKKGMLLFKLNDGNEIGIPLPERDIRDISEKLQKILPHATFGYSKDKMQWYVVDPHLLYKDTEKE